MDRRVIVDDTDPSITYTGDWFMNTVPLNLSTGLGPPYLNTLHGIETEGSLSYNFSGTSISVFWTFLGSTSSSAANPSWECLLDGTSTNVTNITIAYPNTTSQTCFAEGLADVPHTFLVSGKGSSTQTFWFDFLQYLPSASASLADAAIIILPSDPIWHFGTGWTSSVQENFFETNQTGAKVNFEFYGASFQWYGYFVGLNTATSTVSYSIDGAAPVNFKFDSNAETEPRWDPLLFTTETLPSVNHQVEVVYNGTAHSAQLTLGYIIVQNGTASLGSSGGVGGGTTTTSSVFGGATANALATGVKANVSKTNIGATAGGVVAGIVVLLLIALSFFLSRRRKYRTVAGRHGESTEHSRYPRMRPVPFQILASLNLLLPAAKRPEPQQSATRIKAPRVVPNANSAIRLNNNAASVDVEPPPYSEI